MSGCESAQSHDVAVAGCGLLGAAFARAFADKGVSVAVWNRMPERAEAIAGAGVTAVADIDEAVRSAALVLTCTATYATTRASSKPSPARHRPAEPGQRYARRGRSLDRWASERGVAYLDGMALSYPQQLLAGDAFVLVSGSPAGWAAQDATRTSMGGGSALRLAARAHRRRAGDGDHRLLRHPRPTRPRLSGRTARRQRVCSGQSRTAVMSTSTLWSGSERPLTPIRVIPLGLQPTSASALPKPAYTRSRLAGVGSTT